MVGSEFSYPLFSKKVRKIDPPNTVEQKFGTIKRQSFG